MHYKDSKYIQDFLLQEAQFEMRERQKHIIAVDSREFSCLTPLCLREKGFWVVPIQLSIGDYVLSDEICVERKSVNTGDLFDSLKSGRLLT